MRTRHIELVKWFDQSWWPDSTADSLAKATGKGKAEGEMYDTTNNLSPSRSGSIRKVLMNGQGGLITPSREAGLKSLTRTAAVQPG